MVVAPKHLVPFDDGQKVVGEVKGLDGRGEGPFSVRKPPVKASIEVEAIYCTTTSLKILVKIKKVPKNRTGTYRDIPPKRTDI